MTSYGSVTLAKEQDAASSTRSSKTKAEGLAMICWSTVSRLLNFYHLVVMWPCLLCIQNLRLKMTFRAPWAWQMTFRAPWAWLCGWGIGRRKPSEKQGRPSRIISFDNAPCPFTAPLALALQQMCWGVQSNSSPQCCCQHELSRSHFLFEEAQLRPPSPFLQRGLTLLDKMKSLNSKGCGTWPWRWADLHSAIGWVSFWFDLRLQVMEGTASCAANRHLWSSSGHATSENRTMLNILAAKQLIESSGSPFPSACRWFLQDMRDKVFAKFNEPRLITLKKTEEDRIRPTLWAPQSTVAKRPRCYRRKIRRVKFRTNVFHQHFFSPMLETNALLLWHALQLGDAVGWTLWNLQPSTHPILHLLVCFKRGRTTLQAWFFLVCLPSLTTA